MRERELQDIEPRGGLQADGMGLGKTGMLPNYSSPRYHY